MGALHRCRPCPTAWIGKKLGALHWHTLYDYMMFGVFCTCFFFFFVNYCITKGEMTELRRDNERAREVEIAWWTGVLQRGKWKKQKLAQHEKAKNVMIQDERKGSRGRGVMAGGGESQSERKMENRREGEEGERAVISQPSSHANLCQLQLKSFLLFLLLLLGPLTSSLPPFLSVLHFPIHLPPPSLRPLSLLQCITNSDRESSYNSSLQLPDATLNFAKKHPLMEDKALARPLLLTKGVNFTRLAVDRVNALDQRAYNMLFIGTGTNCMRAPVIPAKMAPLVDLVEKLPQKMKFVLIKNTFGHKMNLNFLNSVILIQLFYTIHGFSLS